MTEKLNVAPQTITTPFVSTEPSAQSRVATVVQPESDFSLHNLTAFGEDVLKEAILVILIALVVRKQVAKAIAEKIAEEFTKILTSVTSASTTALTLITSNFDKTLRENEARFHTVLARIEDRIVRDWTGTMQHVREATVYEAWGPTATRTSISQEAERLIEAKQFAKAEEKLRSAKEDDWDSLKLLVKLLLSQHVNRPDDALVVLLSRQTRFQKNHEFHWELANVYMAKQDQPHAIEAAFAYVQLTTSLRLDPETRASALISLGYTYYWFGDHASAIIQTKEALATLGASPARQDLLVTYRANLAYYFAELRQNRDEALKYAEEAVQFLPHNANCLDTRGYVRMQFAGYTTDANSQEILDLTKKKADLEAAKKDFTAAGEMDPTTPDYYEHLARVNALLQALEQTAPGPNL